MGCERGSWVMGVAAEAEILAPLVPFCWLAECCTAAARSWAWAWWINSCCWGVRVSWGRREQHTKLERAGGYTSHTEGELNGTKHGCPSAVLKSPYPTCFTCHPSSNTHDSKDQLWSKICRSLIIMWIRGKTGWIRTLIDWTRAPLL